MIFVYQGMPSRRRSHCCDCDNFRMKLVQCINQLDSTQRPVTWVNNIATKYDDKSSVVNVEKAIDIGCQQMKKFV